MGDAIPVPRHILFLMADTGGGHRSAAQAIFATLDQVRPGAARATLFDFLTRCTSWPLNRAGSLYGAVTSYAPWAWAALYAATDGPRRMQAIMRLAVPTMSRSLVGRFRTDPPDVLVSVHPLANHLAVAAAASLAALPLTRRSIPVITVVTDLVTTHASWFCPEVDRCVVPTMAAGERGLSYGMPRHKMQVTGLPVDPRFVPAPVDRRALGLERDRLTVLLVGGGEGMARVYALARAIASARLPLQLAIIAGRNSRLRQRLESVAWEIPTVVRGFVTDMPLWMQAADVIVTKAGPGTISEAVAVGLPILLYGFVPGQEAGNVRWVVDSGAGLFVSTSESLVAALCELADPSSTRLAEMRDRVRRLARPDAALHIAHLILSLMFP